MGTKRWDQNTLAIPRIAGGSGQSDDSDAARRPRFSDKSQAIFLDEQSDGLARRLKAKCAERHCSEVVLLIVPIAMISELNDQAVGQKRASRFRNRLNLPSGTFWRIFTALDPGVLFD